MDKAKAWGLVSKDTREIFILSNSNKEFES